MTSEKTARPAPAGRRTPTQERAQRTIQTIFEATAQIVESEGEDGLTTNKVAKKAGFSIGTLYQYFPSKEAIVLAMIHRHREQVQRELQALLDAAVAERREVQAVVREVVRLLVEHFGAGSRSRRALIRLGWRLDHQDRVTEALRQGAERNALALAQIIELGDATVRPPTPALMFVVTRALMGAIRSASLESSPLLGTQVFEDELVRLVWGMLRV
jgi:AcrR family transcriptional regulator